MKNTSRFFIFWVFFLVVVSCTLDQPQQGTMAFTVSMEQPHTHYYHVIFRCQGLRGETCDFKMPAWTPGYYRIMDYAQNVLNFRAEDGAGNPLAWKKAAKNIWRIRSGDASSIKVSYDVYAFRQSVADSFLDDTRATSSALDRMLDSKKAGDKLRILISRRNQVREIEVTLGKKRERSFEISLMPNPTPLQSKILEDWLKERL
jgi:predicted metalloprotease with PDZ domain